MNDKCADCGRALEDGDITAYNDQGDPLCGFCHYYNPQEEEDE